MDIPQLENLSITGDISVQPVTTRVPRDPHPFLYLVMGPTGAGKSSFIEAFAGESQKLSISKDQLAGYTQTITAYQLVNVMYTHWHYPRPVYLIDTPGFSDSKISEMEILNMIRKWSQDNGYLNYSRRLLYFMPITETRLPGSRRRTFKMLKKLFESSFASLIVITTMWDTVHNERTQNRAESKFAQLRDETLTEFVQSPSTDIIKFMNTRNSALLAIDHIMALTTDLFTYYQPSASPLLYQDLHDRIQGALQEKQIIELDLVQREARVDANLRAILKRNWMENHRMLAKFIDQFDNFGGLPLDCVEAARDLRKSIAAANVNPNMKARTLFGRWELEPVIRVDRSSDGTVRARLSIDTADLLKDRGRLVLDDSKRRVTKLFKRGE